MRSMNGGTLQNTAWTHINYKHAFCSLACCLGPIKLAKSSNAQAMMFCVFREIMRNMSGMSIHVHAAHKKRNLSVTTSYLQGLFYGARVLYVLIHILYHRIQNGSTCTRTVSTNKMETFNVS